MLLSPVQDRLFPIKLGAGLSYCKVNGHGEGALSEWNEPIPGECRIGFCQTAQLAYVIFREYGTLKARLIYQIPTVANNNNTGDGHNNNNNNSNSTNIIAEGAVAPPINPSSSFATSAFDPSNDFITSHDQLPVEHDDDKDVAFAVPSSQQPQQQQQVRIQFRTNMDKTRFMNAWGKLRRGIPLDEVAEAKAQEVHDSAIANQLQQEEQDQQQDEEQSQESQEEDSDNDDDHGDDNNNNDDDNQEENTNNNHNQDSNGTTGTN